MAAARVAHRPTCPTGVNFGNDIINYILTVRPPSGGRFLARPEAKTLGFKETKYGGFSKTYLQPAYKLAFPDVSPEYLKRIGTHSGRLTLAQLLWNQGFERRLIADAGGWLIKREVVDLYFSTAALHITVFAPWRPLTSPRQFAPATLDTNMIHHGLGGHRELGSRLPSP